MPKDPLLRELEDEKKAFRRAGFLLMFIIALGLILTILNNIFLGPDSIIGKGIFVVWLILMFWIVLNVNNKTIKLPIFGEISFYSNSFDDAVYSLLKAKEIIDQGIDDNKKRKEAINLLERASSDLRTYSSFMSLSFFGEARKNLETIIPFLGEDLVDYLKNEKNEPLVASAFISKLIESIESGGISYPEGILKQVRDAVPQKERPVQIFARYASKILTHNWTLTIFQDVKMLANGLVILLMIYLAGLILDPYLELDLSQICTLLAAVVAVYYLSKQNK